MTPEVLGFIMLGALITTIFIGFPISLTLIFLSIIFGYIGFGSSVFYLMSYQTMGIMNEEVLAAVPLFIFMGFMLQSAGLMERMFKGFQLLLAPLNGSLYLAVLFTSAIFAMATGIAGASVTILGIMSAPIMIRSQYDVRMSAGAIIGGGTLGILIPPSVMLVLLGPVAGVSVVELFAATIIPGFILTFLYITYTLVRCHFNPALGPPLPHDQRAPSIFHILEEIFFGMLPIGFIIFASLGSILFGIATPTEASGVAAFASIVLCMVYRRFTISKFKESLLNSLETSSMVLFLAVASNIFGAVFSHLGTSTLISDGLLSLSLSPIVMVLMIDLLVFILGWPLEWPTIILVFIPIFLPVIKALGINPLWFSVLIAVNLQTSFLSPPVAMSAYYLKGVVKEWSLNDIYYGMGQFMVLQVIGFFIIFFFPELTLWLPRYIY